MHQSVFFAYQSRQRIHVCRFQLRKSAIIKDLLNYRMHGDNLLKHLFARRILTGFRLLRWRFNLHFVKQNLAKLLRRGDVKLCSGSFVNLVFNFFYLQRLLLADLLQVVAVNFHAVSLHGGKHRNERHLNLIKQLNQLIFS